ncbi:hypothetical protein QZH41_007026 [Actinostola sp. cb2023]|nr:hypothetical protein QZH41_007026 [Actinostola sp. cb2023]
MNAFHFSELIFLAIVAYTHASELSMDGGNYVVKWTYMPLTQEIEFDVRAKATGWVGLGITKFNSGMKKMDIIVGGNYQGAMTYLKDYYSTATTKPIKDSQQDYTLISATQTNGKTVVVFKRKLKTGDEKDIEIVKLITSNLMEFLCQVLAKKD